MKEAGYKKSEDGSQKTGVRRQKSEDRSQKTGVRSRKSEAGLSNATRSLLLAPRSLLLALCSLLFVLCPPSSVRADLTNTWQFTASGDYTNIEPTLITVNTNGNGYAELVLQGSNIYRTAVAEYTNSTLISKVDVGADVGLRLAGSPGSYPAMGTFVSRVLDGGAGNTWQSINARIGNDGYVIDPTLTLVAYYSMDNDDWLEVVSGTKATVVATGVVFTADAIIGGYAGSFDGVKGYLLHDRSTGIDGAVTVSFWCKIADPDALSLGNYYPISLGNIGSSLFSVRVGGGYSQSGWASRSIGVYGGGEVSSTIADTFNTAGDGGKWRHIVVCYNNATSPRITIYKNGLQLQMISDNVSGNLGTQNRTTIGSRVDGFSYWQGLIDEVAIWNRALSSNEVYSLYVNRYRDLKPLNMKVRSGSSAANVLSKNFVGSDGTTNSYYYNEALVSSSDFDTSERFAQYKLSFWTSTNRMQTPFVDSVALYGTRGVQLDNALLDFSMGQSAVGVTNEPNDETTRYVALAKQENGGYYTNGVYESRIFDAGASVTWQAISWTAGNELADVSSGPVGLFHLNGLWSDTATSRQGDNTPSTKVNATFSSLAKLGSQAAVFDGSSSHVTGFSFTNVFSVMFWINDENVNDGIMNMTGGSYVGISNHAITVTGMSSNMPTIYVNGRGTTRILTPGWNHVAVVWVARVDISGLDVGVANGDYMKGMLDEIAVYDRSVTITEIKTHYITAQPGGGGNVKFQVRAAATTALLSSAPWSVTYEDPTAANFFSDGQFFQYKVTLTGDGNSTRGCGSVRITETGNNGFSDLAREDFLRGTFQSGRTAWWGDEIRLRDIASINPGNIFGPGEANIAGVWHLDEPSWGVVVDSSGRARNGTAGNGAEPSSSSKVGAYCGAFDGSNDYVQLAEVTEFEGSAFTVAAWFNSTQTNRTAIVSTYGGAASSFTIELNGDGVGDEPGRVAFVVDDGVSGSRAAVSTISDLNDGAWHHVTAVRDRNCIYLYVDGDMTAGQFLGAGYGIVSRGAPYVAQYGTAGRYYRGLIDEIIIWGRALTGAEVGNLAAGAFTTAETGQYVCDTLDSGQPAIWQTLTWVTDGPYSKPLNTSDSTLAGLWRMEDSGPAATTNSVSSGNNGAVNGAPAFGEAGRFGKCLRFDGSADYITVPNYAAIEPASAFSVEAWVNAEEMDTRHVFNKRSGNSGYVLATDASGAPYFWVGSGAGGVTCAGYVPIRIGKWTHLAGTYDGAKLRLYVDGQLRGSSDLVGGVISSGADAAIGRDSGGAGYFDGLIDEVAVHSRALGSEEALDHYRAGAMTLKFQARSAYSDSTFSGINFVGPGGQTNTYFTVFAGEDMVGIIPLGRYFQFRAYLGSEDYRFTPRLSGVRVFVSAYPSSNPYMEVVPSAGYNFLSEVVSFTNQYSTNAFTGVRYLVTGDTSSWYYWNGSQWSSGTGYNNANTWDVINSNIGSLYDQLYPKVGGSFRFRAYLHSDGDQQMQLDWARVSVAEGRIVVVEPDYLQTGDNAWIVGVTNVIKWITAGKVSDNLSIYYSTDSGASWTNIATGVANTSNYLWRTPGSIGADERDNCRIRIVDANDAKIQDESDGDFQLRYRFHILKPNGGEKWYTGRTNNIVWVSAPALGNSSWLFFSGDGGTNYALMNTISNQVSNTNNIYAWFTPKDNPDILSEQARLGISIEGSQAFAFDGSDSNLVIGGIRFITPAAGVPWKRGAMTNVVWVSSGAGAGGVKLEMSPDGGTNWMTITNTAPNVTGTNTHQWSVSAPDPTALAILRATANDDTNVWGESAMFTVADIDFKAPLRDDKWQSGTTNTIKWTSGGAGDRVNLYYSTNNGAYWAQIPGGGDYPNQNYPATNSFDWVIPSDPSAAAVLKIAAVQGNESLYATSLVFNIAGVRVDYPNGAFGESPWQFARSETIRWTFAAAGPSAAGQIRLSYGGDTNYLDISGPGYPLPSLNYTYAPTMPTVQGKVMIVATDPDVTNMWDASDSYFTIAGVKITTPTNGLIYTVDTLIANGISWVSAGTLDDTADGYYAPDGSNWIKILDATFNKETYPGDNRRDWTRAMTADLNPSEAARIKVVAGQVSGVYTGLSQSFVARGLKITRPTTGSMFSMGVMSQISWIEAGISGDAAAKLYISVDGGGTYETEPLFVWDTMVGAMTSASWIVSSTLNPTTNAVVKIVITNSSASADIGYEALSKLFTLSGVKIMSPAATDNWELGSARTVSFLSAGAGALADVYYASDGVNFDTQNPIAASVTVSNGLNNVIWDIDFSRIPSTNARIKVASGSYSAISPSFTVGGVMVTKPINTDIWAIDETNRIEWISVGTQGTNTIEILQSNSVVETITDVTGTYYYWAVSSATSGSNTVIRITDSGGYSGESPVFEIVQNPMIRVVSPAAGEFWRMTETYTIQWSKGGSMNNAFVVTYSTNDFLTYLPIFGGSVTPSNNNMYMLNWTINDPSKLGAAKIFITNTTDSGIMDTSKVFYLSPKFEVREPNGGEVFYALKPTMVRWYTDGDVPEVDMYYSTDIARNPANWVKVNSSPIPCDGNQQESQYLWTLPDVRSATVWLRVQDPHYTNKYPSSLRGPFDDSDNVFEIKYYTIQWNVYDAATSNGLNKLSVSDSIGWSESGLASPIIHEYPYGYFDTVWYRENFHNNVQFNWISEPSRTINVPMEEAQLESSEYYVLASITYDLASSNFNAQAWIERIGTILPDPESCTINIYAGRDMSPTMLAGDLLKSISSSDSDANGVFWMNWDINATAQEKGVSFLAGDIFFAKVVIRYSGVDYSAGVTFTLRMAAAEESLAAIQTIVSRSESNILAGVGSINTNVAALSSNMSVLGGVTAVGISNLTGIAEATTNMLANATNMFGTMGATMNDLTNAIIPRLDYLSNQVVTVINPALTNLSSIAAGIESTTESDLARILTRPTTVVYGSTNSILYKSKKGYGSSVTITVSNSVQGLQLATTMTEMFSGIYQADVVANWGTNDYMVTCADQKAADSMVLSVVGPTDGSVSPTILAMSNNLDRIESQLTNITAAVQAIPNDLAPLFSSISNDLQKIQFQITNALLMEVRGITNAISPALASLSNDVAVVRSDITSGVMPSLAALSNDVAAVVTQITNAIFPTLAAVSNDVAALRLDITNGITPSLAALSNSVAAVVIQITNSISPALASLSNDMAGVRSEITNAVTPALAALSNNVDTLSLQVTNTLATRLAQVSNDIAALTADITNGVVPSLASLSNRAEQIHVEVTNVQDMVQSMKTVDFGGVMSSLSNVQSVVDNIQGGDISSVMTTLSNIQNTVSGIEPTDLSGVESSLALLQETVSGLPSAVSSIETSVQGIDVSGLSRIENQIGTVNDSASSYTLYGRLELLETQLSSVGVSAKSASKKAQTAKTEASAASGGIQTLITNVEKGNLQGALMMLADIQEALTKAQENINEIPKAVKMSELYDSLNSAADTINTFAEDNGFSILLEISGTNGLGGGAEGGGLDKETIGTFTKRLNEVKDSLAFMRKLVDETQNQPVIQEELRGAE